MLFPSGAPSKYNHFSAIYHLSNLCLLAENWEYDTQVNKCINKIGSNKIDNLIKEPSKLKEERTSILEQTQELTINNYKTFIQTAECSRELFNEFNSIENSLDVLLEHIPKFEAKCQQFADETNDICNLRKLNSLTVTRNAQLLEILELPQLMDSFIKDNLYEDALELAAYVRRVHNKHSNIPILKAITLKVCLKLCNNNFYRTF